MTLLKSTIKRVYQKYTSKLRTYLKSAVEEWMGGSPAPQRRSNGNFKIPSYLRRTLLVYSLPTIRRYNTAYSPPCPWVAGACMAVCIWKPHRMRYMSRYIRSPLRDVATSLLSQWLGLFVVLFELGYHQSFQGQGQGHSPCIRICICIFTSAMQMWMQGSAPLNLA